MSHFTVLVIGSNPEQQLAPFQENNMGDCPKEYLKFFDKTEEHKEQYESDTVTRIKLPSGDLVSPWDDRFKVPGAIGIGTGTHEAPKHLERIEVPLKSLYPTFEQYMEDYCGYKDKDPETGRYGYWENPKAKWDWYKLGGRWSGYFILKGSEKRSDQALKRDINFDAMRDVRKLESLHSWEEYETSKAKGENKHPYFHFGIEVVKDEGHPEANENGYRLETKKEFLKRRSLLTTFAIVRDGQWYEKGEMGWFACVSDEKDQTEWHQMFEILLNDLPEDTLLSVYDCHI